MINQNEIDIAYMRQALELAAEAQKLGEVPIGALVVGPRAGVGSEFEVISTAFNERETKESALAHAEVTAIAKACEKLGRWRLSGCTLYVTLEPCVMCCGAIVQARIDRVVYGARDAKGGAVESLYQVLTDSRLNHRPKVQAGILSEECGGILSNFFRDLRNGSKN